MVHTTPHAGQARIDVAYNVTIKATGELEIQYAVFTEITEITHLYLV